MMVGRAKSGAGRQIGSRRQRAETGSKRIDGKSDMRFAGGFPASDVLESTPAHPARSFLEFVKPLRLLRGLQGRSRRRVDGGFALAQPLFQ